MRVCSFTTPATSPTTPPPKQSSTPRSGRTERRNKKHPPTSKPPKPQKHVHPMSGDFSNTVAVCSLMKDEEVDDVMEWIEYHRCASLPQSTEIWVVEFPGL